MSGTKRTDTTVNIEKEPTDRRLDEISEYYDIPKKDIVSRLVETSYRRMLEDEMTRLERREYILRTDFGIKDDDLVESLLEDSESAQNVGDDHD